MSRLALTILSAAVCFALVPLPMPAQIAEYTRAMEKRDGFFPIYWDASRGKVLLEVPLQGEEFLYLRSLATGFGIAGADIDRGRVGDEGLARWERSGPRMHLVLENPRFRALTGSEAMQRSVRESFPTSTIAALEIVAEEGGRALLDATPLALSDVGDIRGELRSEGQGNFSLDRDRSRIYLPHTKAFPRNTEIEASLTFVSDNPGRDVRMHAPDGYAVTIREHHSFVRLPEPGFTPRKFDPRVGIFPVTFFDFSKPFDADYVTRYASRHRLQKRNRGPAPSEPIEPIVYYLDPGVPEPYRTAFKQGAMWWNEAFEAAGFINGFRVEDMPDDMDPLDARYDVIQWVHRTAPSSSWGSSFVDPRTGEIIKAAVRMDSHRSLADFNIYAGLIPAGAVEGMPAPAELEPSWLAALDTTLDAEAFTMWRRRQHSAHEVGHTLGLAHNFIGHADERSTAMDYPPPVIKLTDGRIDLSEAYREGLGLYDTLAIRYAYEEFASPEAEEAGLAAIVQEMARRGVRFMTNPDENAAGSFPDATTWIGGGEVIGELQRTMEVRRALLDEFDERAIAPGVPMSSLNARFSPVYLHHRYSIGAAVKAIGGMKWRYAVRGDTQPPTELIDAATQRRALGVLLDAIQPKELAVPERVLALIAPPAYGYRQEERRAFGTRATPAFDQVEIARVLSTMVVRPLFMPARAARLVAFHDRDPRLPSLTEVIGTTIDRTWGASHTAREAALGRVAERVVVDELMRLAADSEASVEARAGAEWGLRRIAGMAAVREGMTGMEAAHRQLVRADINRFLERTVEPTRRTDPTPPPAGTPIGGGRP
ncbi:MAG TPA: zinc-dependent metalloprotease [Gemmatimonadaceae bacterium]|nr:zinc-dependent metalloprotease [Gemmatimonadaceae bacterium]